MLLAMFYIKRAAESEHSPKTPASLLGPKLGQKPEHWHTLVHVVVHMVSGTVFSGYFSPREFSGMV